MVGPEGVEPSIKRFLRARCLPFHHDPNGKDAWICTKASGFGGRHAAVTPHPYWLPWQDSNPHMSGGRNTALYPIELQGKKLYAGTGPDLFGREAALKRVVIFNFGGQRKATLLKHPLHPRVGAVGGTLPHPVNPTTDQRF